MQRDIIVSILYDSNYNQYKIVKIANIINYQYWEDRGRNMLSPYHLK